MNSRIIAVSNHKGGVGKTTTVVNTAAALALQGYKVLVVDLDPQRNATFCLTSNEYEEAGKPTIADTLLYGKPLAIYPVKENIDLVPAAISLIGRSGSITDKTLLKEALAEVADNYDFVFIDCPPDVGILTLNAITAAEGVVVTITADCLAVGGLQNFEAVVKAAGTDVIGYLLTRYNNRLKLNRLLLNSLRASSGTKLFSTVIREAVVVREAPFSRSDLYAYAPKSEAAKDYAAFANELVQRLK